MRGAARGRCEPPRQRRRLRPSLPCALISRSHFVLMRRIDVGWARMANNLLPLVSAIVLAGLTAATVLVVIAVGALHQRHAHNADKPFLELALLQAATEVRVGA